MADKGRPIEYSAEVNKKAKKYLQDCIDEEYDYNKTVGSASNSYEKRVRVNLPSIEGLAVYLQVARSTIYLWEKDYQEFSDTLEEIRAKQAKVVMEKGLSGDYNPTIAKLILSNNHGYKERSDNTTNDKDIIFNFDSVFKDK